MLSYLGMKIGCVPLRSRNLDDFMQLMSADSGNAFRIELLVWINFVFPIGPVSDQGCVHTGVTF